ncbi:MAG: hypothetical protein IKX33_09365 [Prevotella sp.]|nr:hypothetical protein [Prevotella sp.]
MMTTTDYTELNDIVEYIKEVPYDVTRRALYSANDLYDGYDGKSDSFEQCYDSKVYKHFIQKGKQAVDVKESLARTLHDHAIHVALDDFFQKYPGKLCVGVMGGHALLRTDPMFREIVLLSKRLTELGFYMLSGGGPGAMEATHLGAWMAGQSDEAVEDALETLSVAPSFKDAAWLASAFMVMRKYPQQQYVSLGIPTWLYGHEPSTPFATHIAKFFENSIREDSILTFAYGGIVYTPGSAGTMQEIFQDAVQNHYLSFGFSSPMVFMGKDYWTKEMPVYPLLESLMHTGKYKNLLLFLTDKLDEIVAELQRFRNSG